MGFLILSILVGSGFAASTLYKSRGNGSSAADANRQSELAFAAKTVGGSHDAEIAALEAMETNGATTQVADLIAQKLVKRNPEGPIENNGELSIVAPGEINDVLDSYIKTHNFSTSTLITPITDSDIKIIESSSTEALNAYFSKIADITSGLHKDSFNVTTFNENQLLDNSASLTDTVHQLKAVETPRPLVGFQKSLVGSLTLSGNYIKLIVADPLSANALSSTYNTELTQAANSLSSEASNLESMQVFPSDHPSLAQKMLGIPTAHAFVVAVVVANLIQEIKNFLLYLRDHAISILTEALINKLYMKLSDQVMKWIGNNGSPQFIANWSRFLGGTAAAAANRLIQTQYQNLCKNLGAGSDLVAKALGGNPSGCSSAGAIPNLRDFNTDFRNGGWGSYVKLIQPQNNFLGALTMTSDQQRALAMNAVENAKNEALAGNGFLGTKACDNGKKPDADGTCADGSTPHTTTPGKTASDILSKTFSGTFDRLFAVDTSNGNGYAALANFLVNAALSKLLKNGVNGIQYGYTANTVAPTAPAPETPAGNVTDEVQQILTRKESSLDDARNAVTTLGDTVSTLQQVVNACTANPSVPADATAEIQALVPMQDELSQKVEALKPQVDGLTSFSGTLAELHAQFGTVDDAQREAEDISTKRASVEGIYLEAGSLFASCSQTVISTPVDTTGGEGSASSTETVP